jgi:hypothetical protein
MKKFFVILVIAVIALTVSIVPAEARGAKSHNYGVEAAAQFMASGAINPKVFQEADKYMAKNYPGYKPLDPWSAVSEGFSRSYRAEIFDQIAVFLRWNGELVVDRKVVGTWTSWSK